MISRVSTIGIICLSGLFLIMLSSNVAIAGDEVENMLNNPDFDDGTNGWTLGGLADGGAGALLPDKVKEKHDFVIGGILHAKIDGLGNDAWEPEIHSPPFDVKNGEVYTVDFWAKTEPGSERPLLVKFEQLDTWTGPSTTFAAITDEWTEYHYSPTMTMGSPPQVVLHITFEGVTDDVWFDHFRVYQGEYVPEAEPEAMEPIGKLSATWGDIKNR